MVHNQVVGSEASGCNLNRKNIRSANKSYRVENLYLVVSGDLEMLARGATGARNYQL